MLLQKLYSIRIEIQLCHEIGFNMLYRWFLDRAPSDKSGTPEVLGMNHRRFEEHGYVRGFFDAVTAIGLEAGGPIDRMADGMERIERNPRPLPNAEAIAFE